MDGMQDDATPDEAMREDVTSDSHHLGRDVGQSAALDPSWARLDQALAELEAVARRRRDTEARRGDLEMELSVMQDDRARLAADLDGTLTRLGSVELAATGAVERLDRAMAVLGAALQSETATSPLPARTAQG